MRIALCGAAGTGKTTLVKIISEITNIEINPVGARSVAQGMGFDSPYDVDAAGARAAFQERLLAEKLGWERQCDSFITDRTYFDHVAYCMMHCPEVLTPTALQMCADGLRLYDAIFFCPISAFHNLSNDPQRKHDKVYQRTFDMLLRGLFEEVAPEGILHSAGESVFPNPLPPVFVLKEGDKHWRTWQIKAAWLKFSANKKREAESVTGVVPGKGFRN